MRTRIPLPTLDNKAFSDMMDYIETIKSRKQKGEQEKAKLEQDQKQFEANKLLEQMKLNELRQYHQGSLAQQGKFDALKADLLRARIEDLKQGRGRKETPDERMDREVETAERKENVKEGSKLVTAGRTLQGVHEKAAKLKKLLEENPGLTGIRQGTLSNLNLSQSKALAEFDQTARRLQADMARYGSQRGGAQALKWAERAKPSNFRSEKYNLGMIDSILEDVQGEHENMSDEYQTRLKKNFPIKGFGQKKGKMVKVRDNETGQVHEMTEDEANRLIAGG
jgi:hypothetical protein